MKNYFEEERKWFLLRTRLKIGFATVFCPQIRRRISWDWIKADRQWKANFKTIADYAEDHVSDDELEKFLNKQNIKKVK